MMISLKEWNVMEWIVGYETIFLFLVGGVEFFRNESPFINVCVEI